MSRGVRVLSDTTACFRHGRSASEARGGLVVARQSGLFMDSELHEAAPDGTE